MDFAIEWQIQDSKIECIPMEITQILSSLINNSFDAIIDKSDRWIKVIVSGDPGVIKISIIDSGEGLPGVVQEHLMEPFFTTKAVNKGMGLSLSIAKTYAEKHKGHLSYDKTSHYTKFDLEIPRKHLASLS